MPFSTATLLGYTELRITKVSKSSELWGENATPYAAAGMLLFYTSIDTTLGRSTNLPYYIVLRWVVLPSQNIMTVTCYTALSLNSSM